MCGIAGWYRRGGQPVPARAHDRGEPTGLLIDLAQDLNLLAALGVTIALRRAAAGLITPVELCSPYVIRPAPSFHPD